jgi:Holliday junction DNA helicase RuvA
VISRLRGQLVSRDAEGVVEVETAGGVVYEAEVPLTVLQRMPELGASIELRTLQVVRDDSVALFGFLGTGERELFRRLMVVKGVGPKLALKLLSAYAAPRLARALAEKEITALQQVSGVGKKTAERLALELWDKVGDLAMEGQGAAGVPTPPIVQEAVSALVTLGYSFADADGVVRRVLEEGTTESAEELIRKALEWR